MSERQLVATDGEPVDSEQASYLPTAIRPATAFFAVFYTKSLLPG